VFALEYEDLDLKIIWKQKKNIKDTNVNDTMESIGFKNQKYKYFNIS